MDNITITDTIMTLEFALFYGYEINSGLELLEVIEEAEGSELNLEHVAQHAKEISEVIKVRGLKGALRYYRAIEPDAIDNLFEEVGA